MPTLSPAQASLFSQALDPAEEAARSLIRKYVQRGDNPDWLRSGAMGHYGTFAAQISGHLNGKKYSTDWILVERDINGQPVSAAFRFHDIYAAVKSEPTPSA